MAARERGKLRHAGARPAPGQEASCAPAAGGAGTPRDHSRRSCAAPPPARAPATRPPPPHPRTATVQTLEMYDPPVELERTDHTATYIARIGFRYFPTETAKFTDAPFHMSEVIANGASQATLMSSSWDHKNVALLQPNDNNTVPRPPPAPRAPGTPRRAPRTAACQPPPPTGRRGRLPSSKSSSTGIARTARTSPRRPSRASTGPAT